MIQLELCLIYFIIFLSQCIAKGNQLSIEEYDESLFKLRKELVYNEERQLESDFESFSQWAQLGVLYYEREKIWSQGGFVDSLTCFHRAADLYVNNLKFSSFLNQQKVDGKKLKKQYYAVLFVKSMVLYNLKLYGVSLSVANTLIDIIDSENEDSVELLVDSIEYSQLLTLKGNIYDSLGEYEMATKFYYDAFDMSTCNFLAFYYYSNSLSKLVSTNKSSFENNVTSIIALLEGSLRNIKVHSNFSVILTKEHNSKEIRCIYNKAVPFVSEISPLTTMTTDSILKTKKNKENDANIFMKSIFSLLYRSLYLLSEITGHHSRAWQFLQMANNIHKEMLNRSSLSENYMNIQMNRFNGISLELHANKTKNIRTKFISGYWPPSHLKVGLPSKRPVFIVGFYRSGEELLKTILKNFKNIFILPDGFSPLGDIIPKLEKEQSKILSKSKKNKEYLHDSNIKHRQMINKISNDLLESLKRSYNATSSIDGIYSLYTSLNNLMTRDQSFNETNDQTMITNRVIDFEFSNYRNIGYIHLLFPNAIIFNLVRDPLDTLFDCFALGLDDKSNDFIFDTKILTYEYILYLNTINHFRRNLPKKIIFDIRYDELVLNPKPIVNFMLEIMNLSVDNSDIAIFQNKVERDLNHSIQNLGKWTKYSAQLQNNLIKEFNSHLTPLIVNKIIPYYSELGLVKQKSDKSGYVSVPLNWNMSKDFDYKYIVKVFKVRDRHVTTNTDQYKLRSLNITSNYRSALDYLENNTFIERFNADFLLSRKTFDDLLSEQLSKPLAVSKISHIDNAEFQKRIQDIDNILFYSNINNSGSSTCSYATVIMRLLSGRLKSALGQSVDAMNEFIIAESLMNSINEYHILYNDKDDEENANKHKACSKKVNSFSFNLIKNLKAEILMNSNKKDMIKAIEYFSQLIEESFLPLQSFYNLVVVMKELNSFIEEDWYDIYQKVSMIIVKLNFKKDYKIDPAVYDNMVIALTLCDFENVKKDIRIFNDSLLEDMSATFWTLHITAHKLHQDNVDWNCLRTAHVIDSQRFLLSDESVRRYSIEASFDYNKYVLETFREDFWSVNSLINEDSQICTNEAKQTCLNNRNLLFDDSEFIFHSPIFIVGFYRSGSTLLETMLDAHPLIWGMGEDSVFATYITDFDKEFSQLETVSDKLKRQIERDEVIIKYRSKILSEIKLRKLSSNETSSIQVIDKMLNNYRNIGLIHLLFPHSIILHVVRDPLDTLVSCYTKRFGSPYLSFITSDYKILVTEYINYLSIIQHFRNTLPQDKNIFIDIRYESIIANPRREMEKILSIINITWDEQIMSFYSTNRKVYTASRLQVKKPIYQSSVGNWKYYYKSLTNTIIKELSYHLPSLMANSALPFYNRDFDDNVPNINWDFDPTFNYTHQLLLLS